MNRIPEFLWELARLELQPSFERMRRDYGSEKIAIGVRLRNGSVVDVLVDQTGSICGQVVGGQDGVHDEFDFQGSDIVATVERRKKKTGWLPWQWAWEAVDKHKLDE